ncbi:glycosyltransferase [Halomarina oriensis]|uniref:Glycosyltransferase n=1 Tax=Halomarina oriensis TaxID=671145 RepID=A0A6B0GPH1_9EURY|nr:glycosyltransferase [Halomarina oriensis]MWG34563.1 glycosyltransferase [Halomarina oriensis]
MESAPTTDRTFDAYAPLLDDETRREIRDGATAVSDLRVAHVNTTASGGGVAEMLGPLVALSNDLGVDTDWHLMTAPDAFYEVTKAIHNGLQGDGDPLTETMGATYRETVAENAAAFRGDYDVVVLHDPQTLGMADALHERFPETVFVWRCHIDLTDPSPAYLDFFDEDLAAVDHVVVSRDAYATSLPDVGTTVVHPAIDPLTAKNRPLDELTGDDAAAAALDRYPVDPGRPLLLQVSRFDPWKDPLGVVDAYRQVRESVPGVQLAFVGGMPDDDPEGLEVYEAVEAETIDDPDVHLLTNLPDAGVNVMQRVADVVLQKSLREGFALTVSEALWKETPVVGTDVGGIPLQVEDGENGYLVGPEDIDATADRCRRLLEDDALAERLGEQGRETVRRKFLIPRLLADYCDLFERVTD